MCFICEEEIKFLSIWNWRLFSTYNKYNKKEGECFSIVISYLAIKTMNYSISSTQGVDFGTWKGDSKAEALLKNHREAGYDEDEVWLEDGELKFKNEEYRQLIGDVSDWHVDPIE